MTSKGIHIRANDQTVISIYKNICQSFVNHRKLDIVSPIIEDKLFSQEIFTKGYIIIKCKKKDFNLNAQSKNLEKFTYIILYHFITSETLKAIDIKKIINKINVESKKKATDIIIVTQNALSTHAGNFLKDYSNQSDYNNIEECLYEHDDKYCNCRKNNIFTFTYSNFIIDITKHILVPEYTVLTKSQENKLLNDINIQKSNLPKIKKTDPMVVWSNGNAGDIMKFIRKEEVTGNSIYYRVIV
jgi:DNA-directed RNA polymerase subunit H